MTGRGRFVLGCILALLAIGYGYLANQMQLRMPDSGVPYYAAAGMLAALGLVCLCFPIEDAPPTVPAPFKNWGEVWLEF